MNNAFLQSVFEHYGLSVGTTATGVPFPIDHLHRLDYDQARRIAPLPPEVAARIRFYYEDLNDKGECDPSLVCGKGDYDPTPYLKSPRKWMCSCTDEEWQSEYMCLFCYVLCRWKNCSPSRPQCRHCFLPVISEEWAEAPVCNSCSFPFNLHLHQRVIFSFSRFSLY